jgi:hypothetical protein
MRSMYVVVSEVGTLQNNTKIHALLRRRRRRRRRLLPKQVLIPIPLRSRQDEKLAPLPKTVQPRQTLADERLDRAGRQRAVDDPSLQPVGRCAGELVVDVEGSRVPEGRVLQLDVDGAVGVVGQLADGGAAPSCRVAVRVGVGCVDEVPDPDEHGQEGGDVDHGCEWDLVDLKLLRYGTEVVSFFELAHRVCSVLVGRQWL